MHAEHLHELNRALACGKRVISATVIEAAAGLEVGARLLVFEDGRRLGSLGNERLDEQLCRYLDEHTVVEDVRVIPLEALGELFPARIVVELLLPKPRLVICGAGHIARALAQMALVLEYAVVVVDDRAEFASRRFFPDERITLLVGNFYEVLSQLDVSESSACVIVTRGHSHDESCLRVLLKTRPGYIGMIGSSRRVRLVKDKLLAEGFAKELLDKLYAPIGLDIGARTPQEIALAILSEIVLVKNCPQPKEVVGCRPLSLVIR
ncbi:MAG: XdhC/CoxI family protein [Acidobacteriota bacterium]|nr:XdhC/CoxI family protein [Blastocatellia bacterium]MDW8411179.1 XdhC/CoxI family protein [Acidobacteriota bacterium]